MIARQLSLIVVLAAAVPAAARQSTITPEMDRLLLQAVDRIYEMDFDGADAACRQAQALDPGHPHPYLGFAATDLIRFSYGTEQSDPGLIKSFEEKIAKTITVAEKRLKEDPKNPDVMFLLGSAHGVSGRMAIVRRQWLSAFSHGRKSMKYIRAALKADPELYDAVLGTGMFDYYVATIPKFAGWLAKIMLGGDRARGLAAIKVAAEKGHYSRTAAQLILVEIYTEDAYGERNAPEAARLMRAIHARYPDSAMLHAALIVTLYEDKKLDEAVREGQDFLARVQSGKYPAVGMAKSHALLGTLLWAAGEKEKALTHFLEGAAPRPGPIDRWRVWSRVRAGQLFDALGRREEALASYRQAYSEPDRWEFRALIKPCLDKPCVGENFPGHFAPY